MRLLVAAVVCHPQHFKIYDPLLASERAFSENFSILQKSTANITTLK